MGEAPTRSRSRQPSLPTGGRDIVRHPVLPRNGRAMMARPDREFKARPELAQECYTRAEPVLQREPYGLGWIPACAGMTKTPSRHSRASGNPRETTSGGIFHTSRPRPGNLFPLSRRELQGRSRAQSVHSRHSLDARESTRAEVVGNFTNGNPRKNDESGQVPWKRAPGSLPLIRRMRVPDFYRARRAKGGQRVIGLLP